MAPPAIQVASIMAAGGFAPGERRILEAVNIGASSLSLIGSAFIVLCYLLFKELRKFSFKLVFYLALSVIMATLSLPLLVFTRYSLFVTFSAFFCCCLAGYVLQFLHHYWVCMYHLNSYMIFFCHFVQLCFELGNRNHLGIRVHYP